MSWDTAQQAALDSGTYSPVWFIELEFGAGPVNLCTWGSDITTGGRTYTGLGGVLSVGALRERDSVGLEKLSLSIPTDPTYTALALGNVEDYRGKPARLRLGLLDASYQLQGGLKLRFDGVMEPINIQRQSAKDGSSSGKIEMPLSRSGMSRSRRVDGARVTDAQQQQRFPGDTGLRYLRGLIEKPALWLSIAFQRQ